MWRVLHAGKHKMTLKRVRDAPEVTVKQGGYVIIVRIADRFQDAPDVDQGGKGRHHSRECSCHVLHEHHEWHGELKSEVSTRKGLSRRCTLERQCK